MNTSSDTRRRCGDTDCTASDDVAGCRSDARTKRLLAGVSAQRRERFADRTPYLGTTAV